MRRMVRQGKIPAHLEKLDDWGPTWIINDADIARWLHPDQPLVEVLPSDSESPVHMLRDVREGVQSLSITIREGFAATRERDEHLQQVLDTQLERIAQLEATVQALQAAPRKRWWWPFK